MATLGKLRRAIRESKRDFADVYRGKRSRKSILSSKTKPPMDKHFLSADAPLEFLTNEFIMQRNATGKQTVSNRIQCHVPSEREWEDFIEDIITEGYNVQMTSHNSGFFITNDVLVEFSKSYEGLRAKIMGDSKQATKINDLLLDHFEQIRCRVSWYYTTDGDSVDVPLSNEQLPMQEMYPWMDRPLEQYYEDFMRSNSSILLLFGPPGTGKTTWIKGLLHSTRSNALITYDPNILSRDFVFAEFISGDTNVMVIEDADNFLRKREDGNDLMHKFLNVGSGLISNGRKKLVFSTNLPSIRDVDPALLRPGRCYDILEFKTLDQAQAAVLAQKIGVDIKSDLAYNNTTVAEIFNAATSKKFKPKFGFI